VFCPVNGMVVDPFIGSGTTALACVRHRRKWAGFERVAEYVQIANRRINNILSDPDSDDFFVYKDDDVEVPKLSPGPKPNIDLHAAVVQAIEQYPHASNRQIAELLKTISFSTVARIRNKMHK
jgi:hypothetical protein